MKKLWRRLDVRLFASYLLVALVVVAALGLTVRLVAPSRFDDDLRSASTEESGESNHSIFVSALDASLWLALGASLVAAGIAAALVAPRIVRPVRRVRDATRRLAAGHYDERVTEPGELELAELARDVNRLAIDLENTERRRARLISEVAHEMRTPLTTIEGYIEGMLDHVFETDEEALVAVGEEAARLQRLASELAELSRSEEGAIDVHLERVDLRALVNTCAARLQPQFDDKQVTLTVEDGAAVSAVVDADRITQVVTNLLGNALTYTPSGGRVTARVRASNDRATVAVSDTGIGISAGDLPLVFDRFYRVPGPERPAGGSGIGLTIARGIARVHHGDITAASPGLGQGSTFTLDLPVETRLPTEA